MTDVDWQPIIERLLKVFNPAQVDVVVDFVGNMVCTRDAKIKELEKKISRLEQIETLKSANQLIGFGR